MSILDLMLGEVDIRSLSLVRRDGVWKCTVRSHDVTYESEGPTPTKALLHTIAQVRKAA